MALVLIALGFDSDRVYKEMGQAEFTYHFLTGMKLITRSRILQSSVMISSLGSLFVKPDQKTIIEELNDELAEIDGLIGREEQAAEESKEPADPFDKLMRQFQEQSRKMKRL